MKRLILFTILLAACMAVRGQVYKAPGIPTGSTSVTLTQRTKAGATDTARNFWFALNGNQFWQFYTSYQINKKLDSLHTVIGSSDSTLYKKDGTIKDPIRTVNLDTALLKIVGKKGALQIEVDHEYDYWSSFVTDTVNQISTNLGLTAGTGSIFVSDSKHGFRYGNIDAEMVCCDVFGKRSPYIALSVKDSANRMKSITMTAYDGDDSGTKGILLADTRDTIGSMYADTSYNANGRRYDTWIPSWKAVKSRIDSAITVHGGAPTSRTLTINGTALDLSANRSWSVGTVTSITPGYGFTSSTPITGSGTMTNDTTKLQTVLNFFPKADTRYLKLSGGTLTGAIFLPAIALNAGTGTTKDFQWRNNNIIRWDLYENATTESGSNAGSDLVLNGFSDDGATAIPAFSVKRSTGVLDFKVGPTLNGSTTGLEPNALHTTSTFETKTGVLKSAGFITNNSIGGNGIDRTDPQLLVDNLGDTTQHAIIEIYNGRGHDEAAITYNGKLSNATNVQNGADFMRYVGDVNTFNAYHVVHGFHQVGYNEDNTALDLFSNNSVGLADGATSGLPWNTLPRANSVRIGLTNGGSALDANGSLNVMGATSFNLPTTGKSISLFYRIDGGNDYGLIQAIDNATSGYKPLTIASSALTLPETVNINVSSGSNLVMDKSSGSSMSFTRSGTGNVLVEDDGNKLGIYYGSGSTLAAQIGATATFSVPVVLKGYTVSTLPSGSVGMTAYVTDATAPTYNGALTGGGAVTVPVFYNGSAWVSH